MNPEYIFSTEIVSARDVGWYEATIILRMKTCDNEEVDSILVVRVPKGSGDEPISSVMSRAHLELDRNMKLAAAQPNGSPIGQTQDRGRHTYVFPQSLLANPMSQSQTANLPIPGSLDRPTSDKSIDVQALVKSSELEQEQCAKLERDYQDALARLKSLGERPLGTALTPEELAATLNFLYALDQSFLSHRPVAEKLAQDNLPKLSQRLSEISAQIESDINAYADMYKLAVKSRTDWATMQKDAAAQASANFLQANQHAQQVIGKSISAMVAAGEQD
ncbi:MAG: hypothetical protein ABSF50_11245 [Burkholderiaceae bacterium]|jgi:hypothetical protein